MPTEANVTNLVRFFQKADRGGLAFAWEPTAAWPEKVVWTALPGAAPDPMPQDPFEPRPPTAHGVVYFRLTGKSGYSYRYTDADLQAAGGLVRRQNDGLLPVQQRQHVGRRPAAGGDPGRGTGVGWRSCQRALEVALAPAVTRERD